MNLADRCFDRAWADDELFDTIQVLLGGRPSEECLEDGFEWRVGNCWVDPYDASVEVVIPRGQPHLTRETADKVLALGFGRVYENVADQERCVLWTASDQGWGGNHWSESSDRWEVLKLRARVKELGSWFART